MLDFSHIAKKLNANAKLLNIDEKINFLSDLSLHEFAKIVASAVPFAKIAVLSTEKSYLDFTMSLCKQLKKANLRPICVCLQKEKRFSVDGAKGVFSLAEDVRYLIVTDTALSEIGLYFATVRNIPALFIVNGFDFKGLTASNIFVDNGKLTEKFTVSAKRVIVFDSNNFNYSDIADGIAMVGSKITALIDYKINAVLSGKEQNGTLIELVEQAIDDLLNLDDTDRHLLAQKVLCSSFTVELVRLSDDNFYNCSSAVITSLLAENVTKESAVGEFFGAKKAISRFVSAFSVSTRGENVCDYNYIARRISDCSGRNFAEVCKDVLCKINLLNEYSGGVERLRLLLKNTVQRAQKEMYKIDKLYKENGGKKVYCSSKISESVELAGYVGKSVNGLTLVKESGF